MDYRKIKTGNLPRFISHFIVPFIVGALVGLGLCSCSPCERLYRRCPPIEYVRDSIVVYDTFFRETTITDTLLYVKLIKGTERVSVQITDTARAETAYAEAEAYVVDDNIRLLLTNKDSAEVLVQRIKTLERQLRESYHEKETGKVQTVYKTRRIVRFFAGMGMGALLLLLLRIVVFIARRK